MGLALLPARPRVGEAGAGPRLAGARAASVPALEDAVVRWRRVLCFVLAGHFIVRGPHGYTCRMCGWVR